MASEPRRRAASRTRPVSDLCYEPPSHDRPVDQARVGLTAAGLVQGGPCRVDRASVGRGGTACEWRLSTLVVAGSGLLGIDIGQRGIANARGRDPIQILEALEQVV